eukprot:10528974-Karenia_brevis.AAC.1
MFKISEWHFSMWMNNSTTRQPKTWQGGMSEGTVRIHIRKYGWALMYQRYMEINIIKWLLANAINGLKSLNGREMRVGLQPITKFMRNRMINTYEITNL